MASRGPYAKTARTREVILDAALRIVSENGYSGATVQQIADAVGMSKPGVLHHFGSRDGLLTAILQRRDEVNQNDVRFEPARSVESLIATVRHNATVPGLVALYAATSGLVGTEPDGSPTRSFLGERYPLVLGLLTEGVSAQQRAGTARTDVAAEHLARLLVAASDGLQTQWLLDPSVDMAARLEDLWTLMLAP
jgi:AcrR family transcriptional regulator